MNQEQELQEEVTTFTLDGKLYCIWCNRVKESQNVKLKCEGYKCWI